MIKYKFNTPPAVVAYGKAGKAKYFAKLFKVSAANEVAEMNTFHRAYLVTLAAACTLTVVDGSKVVYYLDCTLGTVLLTLHTADTAVRANLTNLRALVMA